MTSSAISGVVGNVSIKVDVVFKMSADEFRAVPKTRASLLDIGDGIYLWGEYCEMVV